MAPIGIRWNAGMTWAVVLLLIGGGLMFTAPGGTPLHVAGLGIVIAAGVLYLGTRVVMLVKDTRRMR